MSDSEYMSRGVENQLTNLSVNEKSILNTIFCTHNATIKLTKESIIDNYF